MTRRIEINPKSREKLTVSIAGKEYLGTAPKASYGLALAEQGESSQNDPKAMVAMVQEWLQVVFGEKVGAALWMRTTDPDDELDIPDLMELMEKITEATTGDPTS